MNKRSSKNSQIVETQEMHEIYKASTKKDYIAFYYYLSASYSTTF